MLCILWSQSQGKRRLCSATLSAGGRYNNGTHNSDVSSISSDEGRSSPWASDFSLKTTVDGKFGQCIPSDGSGSSPWASDFSLKSTVDGKLGSYINHTTCTLALSICPGKQGQICPVPLTFSAFTITVSRGKDTEG
jgi:hypothetical protein